MSDEFLGKVLRGEISVDEATLWLQSGTTQNEDIVTPCSRIDFVLYFISFLRNQTLSILQKSSYNNINSSTPTKGNSLDSGNQRINNADNNSLVVDKLKTVASPIPATHNEKHDINIFKPRETIKEDFQNDKSLVGVDYIDISNCSTPSKNISLQSIPSNISPIYQENLEFNKSDIKVSTPNNKSVNFQSTPLRILHNNSSRKNDSQNDSQYKKTYSTPSHKNYNQKTHTHPQFDNNHSYQHESKSFGNAGSQHQSFERPTSQRTNICIGDFIHSKNNALDKNAGKKKKHKFVNLSLDENHIRDSYKLDCNVFNFKDENSFPEIGTSKSNPRYQHRRRINPTRLNMSDQTTTSDFDTSIKNSEKFGIKCVKRDENEAFKNQIFHQNEQDSNFNVERNILKLEKEKLLQKFTILNSSSSKSKSSSQSIITVSRIVTNVNQTKSGSIITITPNLQKVTNVTALDNLSLLYSVILDFNLVVNFATEINFLISLLVTQTTMSKAENVNKLDADLKLGTDLEGESLQSTEQINTKIDEKSGGSDVSTLLYSIHNCVYFSLKTLKYQIPMLDSILDRSTMRMLHQNLRVKMFFPDLSEHFQVVCAVKQTITDNNQLQVITNKNVCFISETDNEENFQTQQSFHTFKKQRDLFYDILRCWESQHNSSNWNFSAKVGAMVRTLLNMSVSPSNLAHLARLFREQLIVNCTGRKTIDEDSLPDVAGASADRLNKLAQRLVAAPSRNVPSKEAKLDFPEYQEFFRDFLITADNAGFRQHIIDSLIEEIHRLNATQFTSMETENIVTGKTKSQYLSCVVNLQILGKFLGLVMSLPYRSPMTLPSSSAQQLTVPKEKVLQSDIAVRCQTQPPLNLLSILKYSKKNGRLILTVPWVVQLFAMLDYSTLRLPYYKNILFIMFQIHQECANIFDLVEKQHCVGGLIKSKEIINPSKLELRKVSQSSRALLKICIGWFFDMVHFPQHYFYSWIKHSESEYESNESNYKQGHSILNKVPNANFENDLSLVNGFKVGDQLNFEEVGNNEKHPVKNNHDEDIDLDCLDLIDCNVMLNVCPHLKELKSILMTNKELSSETDSRTYRHITPVSSGLTEETLRRNKEKQVQIQLEEWFLRSQSQSTSRVLKSVSERVGSALLRLVRSQIPHLKALSESGVWYHTQSSSKTNVDYEIEKLNIGLLNAFRIRCIYAAKQCALERTVSALRGMLPPATAKPVFNLLVELSVRRSIDTVTEWLSNNTNSVEILSSKETVENLKIQKSMDFDEIQEYINLDDITFKQSQKVQDNKKGKDVIFDAENTFISGANCIVGIKSLCKQLISGIASQRGTDYIRPLFEESINSAEVCSKCSHILQATKRTIGQLCLDCVILLISLFPALLTSDVLDKLKIIFINCLQTNQSTDPNIHLLNNENELRKDAISDEIALFQKHAFDRKKNYNTSNNIENVNESLALLEEENLCQVSNKSLNISQDSILNCTNKIEENYSELGNEAKSNEFFNTILCSRNVMYFGDMGGGNLDVWKTLAFFLSFLLKNEFITEDSLTDQSLAIYRKEWPQSTLENFSTCMKELSRIHKLSSPKLHLFLDFVAEFCHNISGEYLEETNN